MDKMGENDDYAKKVLRKEIKVLSQRQENKSVKIEKGQNFLSERRNTL